MGCAISCNDAISEVVPPQPCGSLAVPAQCATMCGCLLLTMSKRTLLTNHELPVLPACTHMHVDLCA
eukprot:2073437-Amphidinium_carterae.1